MDLFALLEVDIYLGIAMSGVTLAFYWLLWAGDFLSLPIARARENRWGLSKMFPKRFKKDTWEVAKGGP